MNEELFEAALRKKDSILAKIAKVSELEIKEAVDAVWVPYEPEGKYPSSVAAVDGGQKTMEFKGFTLYGVGAASLLYTSFNGRYLRAKTFKLADIDVLHPPSVSERIDTFRETLEGKVGYLAATEGVELLLMDGSLRSVLIAPKPLVGSQPAEISLDRMIGEAKDYFGEGIFNELVQELSRVLSDYEKLRNTPLTAQPMLERIRVLSDEMSRAIVAIEYVEKLATYRELLKKVFGKSLKLTFVSKRGRAQNYFRWLSSEKGVPLPADIMIFQYMTDGPGFSKPIIPEEAGEKGRKKLKRMPSIVGLEEFYSEVNVAITYVRLAKGTPVMKVEIPVLGRNISEGAIKEIMDLMAPISAGGYPFPLYEVDKVVRIPRADMVRIVRGLGLSHYLTGREVLEEWLT